MDLKIVNGTVVTAAETRQVEVGVADGRIAAVGSKLPEALECIDAAGCLVLPGCVEAHTHLDFPLAGTVSADGQQSDRESSA
jgi:dihydroorotase-like cyclic amidohydrolase